MHSHLSDKMLERMLPSKASSFLILLLISLIHTCTISFTPSDNYLVDCGSSENTSVGVRFFVGDANLPSETLSTHKSIMANTTSNSVASFDSPSLYKTARIFTSSTSYSFQIRQQGRHFIRLHFYPFVYQSYDLTTAKFNVSTQDITLLTGFQSNKTVAPILKEYLVKITLDTLVLSFVPFSNLAFINAIEVVSVPDNLIVDSAQTVNPSYEYLGLSGQAFETVYRVNRGIPKVTPDNDTLWRTWLPDASFIQNPKHTKLVSTVCRLNYMEGLATSETAPPVIYSTARELASSTVTTLNARFNMTWQFDLQEGCTYMLRFHFCDIVSKNGEFYFVVYVGPWAILTDFNFNSFFQTNGNLLTPLFCDFILLPNNLTAKLSISITPSKIADVLPDGILNGLEIFKLYNSSITGIGKSQAMSHARFKVSLVIILGMVGGAGAMIPFVIISFLLVKRQLEKKRRSKMCKQSNVTTVKVARRNRTLAYQFRFLELLEATHDFDENWVIGVGGFGKVYNGVLKDGTRVAVKRGNPNPHQGINEFRNEIKLLSQFSHRNLVSLVGYCAERNEMILVYEYMEKGTLKSHLYGSDLPPLTWKQRLEICIGSARGLHYLHTELAEPIIHRDVKPTNILLDQNLTPKIADFGLSKIGPELDQSHVSTAVKGSFGYLDPEYFRFQKLTVKSDVYSFGVVLLEVLCARPVVNSILSEDDAGLVYWAMEYLRRGELIKIVDEQIAASIRPNSLRTFGEIVEKCLSDFGCRRPSMAAVLWYLKYSLKLQEMEPDESCMDSVNLLPHLGMT